MLSFIQDMAKAENIVDVNIAAGAFAERLRGRAFFAPLYFGMVIALFLLRRVRR